MVVRASHTMTVKGSAANTASPWLFVDPCAGPTTVLMRRSNNSIYHTLQYTLENPLTVANPVAIVHTSIGTESGGLDQLAYFTTPIHGVRQLVVGVSGSANAVSSLYALQGDSPFIAKQDLIYLDEAVVSITNSTTQTSITKRSATDTTEAIYIPNEALANVGDAVVFKLRGSVTNSTGSNRTISLNITLGDKLIFAAGNSANSIATSTIARAWMIDIEITRVSETKLAIEFMHETSNIGTVGAGTAGEPVGSLSSKGAGRALNHAVDISGGWPLLLKVEAVHSANDFSCATRRRMLRRV